MSARNHIGKRGESIVTARLMDFCGNPEPYFDLHPLGEKCPTFDFLVELVGPEESVPYFFVQVKATKMGYGKMGRHLPVQVKKEDVRRMVLCPVPTYLIGVDEPKDKAYIVSIHGNLKSPITSIPTKYPLNHKNLRILWDEVRAYWQKLDYSAKTSIFTF